MSTDPYNHYSLLRSVEDNFGLPHLGYAGQAGLQPFGADVLNQPSCPEPARKCKKAHRKHKKHKRSAEVGQEDTSTTSTRSARRRGSEGQQGKRAAA